MSDRFPILAARGVCKSFPIGSRGELEILKGLDLKVEKGEAICVVGASGAGKSTLLHILGTLDRPTLGSVLYRGQDLFRQSDDELAKFRSEKLGFVFQFHHLMGEFTALENVTMPARISGMNVRIARERAGELMAGLGLVSRKNHYPSELSGGEQQRVAIARALMNEPEILLADEPTGNLDTKNSGRVQELFFELKERMGITLVVASHNRRFAQQFPRVLHMEDGLWTHEGQSAGLK